MKIFFALVLMLAVWIDSPAYAADPDALKDIPVYQRPSDFETIQKLAEQNRLERMNMLQTAITCIQQAINIDDIHNCQDEETTTLKKIRLSYCDTNLSWSARFNKDPPGKDYTECEKAMSDLTGRPLPPRVGSEGGVH